MDKISPEDEKRIQEFRDATTKVMNLALEFADNKISFWGDVLPILSSSIVSGFTLHNMKSVEFLKDIFARCIQHVETLEEDENNPAFKQAEKEFDQYNEWLRNA